MRHGHEVTFGGSGLDRAAHLRGDAAEMAALLAKGRVLALWRGKPLFQGPEAGLAWLAPDHPALTGAKAPVFLGLEEGLGSFAADLSAWVPEDGGTPDPSRIFDPSVQVHPGLPAPLGFADLRDRMASLTPREAELAATARAVLQWHQSHGFCAACGQASEVVQSGWQRSCPACGAQHFPRTDPVVIMVITHGNRLLMGRSPGWPEGMYSLLAGFIEPGETAEAAVRREVFEESGVNVGEVSYLTSQPWPFPASLMLGFRGVAISDEITVDPNELEDARWVSREELVQIFAGRHSLIKPGRNGAIAHFLMRNWLADRLD